MFNLVFASTEIEIKLKLNQQQQDGNIFGSLETKYKVNDYGLELQEKWNTSNELFTEEGIVNSQLMSELQLVYGDIKKGYTSPQLYLNMYNNFYDLLHEISLETDFENNIHRGRGNSNNNNADIEYEIRSILSDGFLLNFDNSLIDRTYSYSEAVEFKLKKIFNSYLNITFTLRSVKNIEFNMKIKSDSFKTSFRVDDNVFQLVTYKKFNETKFNLNIKLNTVKEIFHNENTLPLIKDNEQFQL
ncbi:uncharacterized protein LOC135954208 [Calliphora vicina]|uniref:uncharacterized protein LOC135954208 n=1 Tax=Calliphora vicina TaxID=7373 RepID=UPI00325ABCBC